MQKVKLGDYVKIKTGKLDANASTEDGIYPFFTCSQLPLKIDKYSYDCECVLVAGNGDLNVKYYNGKFDAYQRTYIIEGRDNNEIVVRYLYYFLDKYVETLRELSIGGVIKYIKLCNLTDAIFPLTSIEEQKAIAEKLDKVSSLIEKRKQQLSLLDTLVKSKFVEMFGDPIKNNRGWQIGKLSEVAELKIGPFGSLLHKEDYVVGGHALINPSHIIDGIIKIDEKFSLSDSKYDELSAYHLMRGDVILGRRGEMGRCAVVDEDGLFCGTGCMIIRPNGKVLSYFLQKVLSSFSMKHIIEDRAVGVTMANLNVRIVSNLPMPIYPMNKQREYIQIIQKTDKLKEKIKQSLAALELLKKSLMQKYFG